LKYPLLHVKRTNSCNQFIHNIEEIEILIKNSINNKYYLIFGYISIKASPQ